MTAGRPIDVLADRRVGSTAAWLRAHPGVRVVCRDGSAAYAEAITQGAPRARQVSDPWHLWHGLSQAALKEVATHSGCWAKPAGGHGKAGTLPRPANAGVVSTTYSITASG